MFKVTDKEVQLKKKPSLWGHFYISLYKKKTVLAKNPAKAKF